MLPKINRIKKKKDFEVMFKNSKSFKNNLFIFKVMKNNLGLNRFGFVVSQKVSKKATIRNKVRRRLAEVVQKEYKNIRSGTDLVLIALPQAAVKNFSEIKEAVGNGLIAARLIDRN